MTTTTAGDARRAALPDARTATQDDANGGPAVLALLAVVAAGAVAGAVWWRRRDGAREHVSSASGPPAPAAPPRPLAGPLQLVPMGVGGPVDPPGSASILRLSAPGQGPGEPRVRRLPRVPTPPDAERSWTAAIAWRAGGEGAAFAAVARDEDGAEAVLAESPPLQWPPADADAVHALAAAADDLTRALLRAGWTPLSRGDAWYARRFAWTPTPARPTEAPAAPEARARPEAPAGQEAPAGPDLPGVPAVPEGRLFRRRPWPEDTDRLWRCELRWNAGWTRSRLEAVAQAPNGGPRRPLAASEAFSWMLHADPAPDNDEVREAVEELGDLLVADGWTEVDPGRRWYARRFVWHRKGEPPSHRDREGADAGRLR